jgi:hypothetical protein
MAEEDACDHNCSCGHAQQDNSTSGSCNPCGENCANSGHYPSECLISPPFGDFEDEQADPDPLAEARRLLAEDQQRRLEACNAEIEQVLARHGMRLQISQPTVTIVPA